MASERDPDICELKNIEQPIFTLRGKIYFVILKLLLQSFGFDIKIKRGDMKGLLRRQRRPKKRDEVERSTTEKAS